MEVTPGIYQLKIPIPPTPPGYVNVYLIQGDRGWLLVDVGWNTQQAFDALQRQLKEIGLGFKDITQIVVTHIHPDHYGLAGRVKQLSQAELAMHRVERDLIETRYIQVDHLLQEVAHWLRSNGIPEDELPQLQKASMLVIEYVTPTLPEITLYGGEVISTGLFHFEVLWTPGHSPGHICLYEREKRILLSGDHILPITTTNVGIHPQSGTSPLDDYLNSLTKMKELDVDLILPAHEHIFQGLQQRIEELFQHHRERQAAIAATIKDKPKTAYQIATEIPWMVESGGANWQKLSPLDKRLAVGETLSHLQSLRGKGKIDRMTRDEVIFYYSQKL